MSIELFYLIILLEYAALAAVFKLGKLSYINNAVFYKYCNLCKSSIKEQKIEVLEIDNVFLPYIENYEDVSTYIELSISMKNLPNKYKDIAILLLKGCSDSEIAEDLGVTRQYINRIKKNIKIL